MPANRFEILKSMLEHEPSNAFARYGLAMEHVNSGNFEEAAREFDIMLRDHPDYVAGYFHGGQTLEKLGRIDAARALYRSGIEASARKGDSHTRSELQAALDLLD